MREKLAARPWLRQRSCFVFRRPGLMASTPADLQLGRKPPVPNPHSREIRDSPARKPRDGREPTPRAAGRPVILPRVPAIPAHPISAPAMPAPLIRGTPRLCKARRVTWATGSISTATFPYRSKSTCCAATQTSGGFPLPSSSG